jgi:DNA-binding NtrC family response regulator
MRVLVVAESSSSVVICDALFKTNFIISVVRGTEEALSALDRHGAEVVFIDIELKGLAALELIGLIRTKYSRVALLTFTTASGYEAETISALSSLGAIGHVEPPFDAAAIIPLLKTAAGTSQDKLPGAK